MATDLGSMERGKCYSGRVVGKSDTEETHVGSSSVNEDSKRRKH